MRFATFVVAVLACAVARADVPPPPKLEKPALRVVLAAPAGKDEAELAGYEIEAGLENLLGRPVRARVAKTYAEAATALSSGEADVAWLQPLAYVKVTATTKVVPLVKVIRRGHAFYRSVLYARADAGLSKVEQLAGKKVGWVETNSSSGYVIPSAMLRLANVKPASEAMLDDHAKLCRAVWSGKVDAGATFSSDDGKTAQGCAAELGADAQALGIIAVSPPIPNDLLVAREGLDERLVTRVREALLPLKPGSAAEKQVLGAFHADGFATVDDADFTPLRKLQK